MAETKLSPKKQRSDSKAALRKLALYTKHYKALFVFAMIFALISVAATLYAPILIGQGVDLIIEKGNVDFKALIPKIILLLSSIMIGNFVFIPVKLLVPVHLPSYELP